MLGNKNPGFYIDVGSCGAIHSNNTYLFDTMGWKGVCIEIDPGYIPSYAARSARLYTANALELNYRNVFEENNAPNSIDYMSLDIDQKSVNVLEILPHDSYRFKVITIEHDYYLYADAYQKKQRDILNGLGYHLLCANVYVQQSGFYRENCAFEDWWIDPTYFDVQKYSHVQCDGKYPTQIIQSFNE
jgi:hypothetical protein